MASCFLQRNAAPLGQPRKLKGSIIYLLIFSSSINAAERLGKVRLELQRNHHVAELDIVLYYCFFWGGLDSNKTPSESADPFLWLAAASDSHRLLQHNNMAVHTGAGLYLEWKKNKPSDLQPQSWLGKKNI